MVRASTRLGVGNWPLRSSVGQGMHRDDLGAREDLLVDDEDEADEVQRGEWRQGQPYLPLLAGRALLGDPAPDGRQPQQDQREADRGRLVEALVEDGVAISLSGAEGPEPGQQQEARGGGG